MAAGNGSAILSVLNGICEESVERQTPTPGGVDSKCRLPAGNRSRHGVGRQRPAPRNSFKVRFAIQMNRHPAAGRTTSVDANRFAARLCKEPERVPTNPGHV